MSVKTLTSNQSDVTTRIRIFNAATGLPATGITHATSGLGLYYQRDGAGQVSITPASLAAVGSAHADGGFIEMGDGWYRVDLPDAAVVGNVSTVVVGATLSGHVAFGPTMLVEPSVAVSVPSWSTGTSLISTAIGTLINAHDTAIDSQLAALSSAIAALNNLGQADVRSALGMAGADLDAQLAALASLIGALPTASENADAAGALTIEGTITLIQALRGLLSVQLGKVSGAQNNLPIFRNTTDSKNRVSATTDANGNRTAVTLDLT